MLHRVSTAGENGLQQGQIQISSFTGRRWHWSGWSGRRAVCRGLLALCRAQLLSHCCHAQDTEEAAASIARGGTLSELRAAVTTAAAASRRRPLLS